MKAGDVIDIPHEGEHWTIIRSSIHEGGDFIVELRMSPNKGGPPFHVHEHEDEVWEVLDGSVIAMMPDGEHTVRAGERWVIPKGTKHTFKIGPDGLHARGSYNGPRFEAIVAQLAPGDKKGFIRMAQHLRRTRWAGSRLTNPLIRGMLVAMGLVGSVFGIRPHAN
jgi:Cupin domain